MFTTLILTLLLTEPGFIQRNGHEVSWSKSALPIWIDFKPGTEQWREIIEKEAMAWNDRLAQEVFKIMVAPLSDDVRGSVIQIRPVFNHNPHTKLWFSKTGMIIAGLVCLPPIGNEYIKKRVAAHELGHILGLDHDPDLPASLMYPNALFDWWTVSPYDVGILRDKYRTIAHGTPYHCS
jgi:hypothetical protein